MKVLENEDYLSNLILSPTCPTPPTYPIDSLEYGPHQTSQPTPDLFATKPVILTMIDQAFDGQACEEADEVD